MSSQSAHSVRKPGYAIIDAMKDERLEHALGEAADEYAQVTAAQKAASAKLADLMREAFAAGEQQSAIIKAARHVWSREYVRIVLGLTKRPSKGADE